MGYITEKIVTEERIKIADCIECGSSDISLDDCGYSSFNIAYGKCNKCGNTVKFNCDCFITKKEIAKAWNKQNDKKLLIKKHKKEIKRLEKEIAKLSKKGN